jgi:toxin ParE1/3/4
VKPVVVHDEARAELDEAMAFYENRARGLGLDLQEKVGEAVTKIQQNPEFWPPHKRSGFRKYFVERFPFTVFYLNLPDCIWIAAIAHGRRRPGYWKKRRTEPDA